MRTLSVAALCCAGLVLFVLVPYAASADDKNSTAPTSGIATPVQEKSRADESMFLPRGNIFKPLLADPRELRFYLAYHPYQDGSQYLSKSTQIFAASLGDVFGLYRSVNSAGGYSWQVSVSGGIYAEFDIRTSSFFLVDTDYTIGFPVMLRKGPASYRLTVYHQSSHVGDEYLLHSNIQRVEFSYEALNLVGSYEWTTWRVYYGGEFMVHKEPSSYKPFTIQGGVEYYGTTVLLLGGRLVGGLDLKCTQENDWPLNSSLKIGLQFDGSAGSGRSIRFLAEGYDGFSPHGQFFNSRMHYAGLALSLEFE
jgi:hypothetical protein